MFTLTAGSLAAAIEHAIRGTLWTLVAAMIVIVLGCLVTLALRTRRIARALQAQ